MNIARAGAMRLDDQHRDHSNDRSVGFIDFGDGSAVAELKTKIDIFANFFFEGIGGFIGRAVIFDQRFPNFFGACANQFELAFGQKAQAIDRGDFEWVAYSYEQTWFSQHAWEYS